MKKTSEGGPWEIKTCRNVIRVVQKLLFIEYPQRHLEDMRTLHHMTIVAFEHKEVVTELINAKNTCL